MLHSLLLRLLVTDFGDMPRDSITFNARECFYPTSEKGCYGYVLISMLCSTAQGCLMNSLRLILLAAGAKTLLMRLETSLETLKGISKLISMILRYSWFLFLWSKGRYPVIIMNRVTPIDQTSNS